MVLTGNVWKSDSTTIHYGVRTVSGMSIKNAWELVPCRQKYRIRPRLESTACADRQRIAEEFKNKCFCFSRRTLRSLR